MMQKGPFTWPIYSMILAFGQLLGFSAFQVAMISNNDFNEDWVTYVTAAFYVTGSLVWWIIYR
jgi:alpha-1,3-glucan synthase